MLLNCLWYRKNCLAYFLLPLSWLYRLALRIRNFLYKIHFFRTHHVSVPVIVVGNITVGGTGKTPLVIALTQYLKQQGFHPGVISRGYRGKSQAWPKVVTENSDPRSVGDEAIIIAKQTQV